MSKYGLWVVNDK